MTRLTEQTAAIRNELESAAKSATATEFVNAAVGCAEELVEHGSLGDAIDLLDLLNASPDWHPDTADRLKWLVVKAWALIRAERTAEGAELVQLALESCAGAAGLAPDDWAFARVLNGSCLWRNNRVAEALRQLEALRQELSLRPDGRASCHCALELASAYNRAGARDDARGMALEAWVIARRIRNPYYAAIASANLAMIERQLGRLKLAEESIERAYEGFSSSGNAFFSRYCLRQRALIHWKRGRLADAVEAADQLRAETTAVGMHQEHWYASLLRAAVLVHMGRFADAEKTLREEPDWQVPSKFSRASLLTVEYLGDIDLEQGRAEAALTRYNTALAQALVLVPRGDIVAELRRRIAECHLMLGDPRRALELASEAIQHCREIRERYDEDAAHRVIALAHAALGDHDAARREFDAGFAAFDESEVPYEWGKLWMAYADWRCAPGSGEYRNDSAAAEAYGAAIDHFERIGAEHRLREARARLEALESRMRADGEDYVPTSSRVRPARRPRLGVELLRRSQWAFDTFGTVTRHPHLISMLEEVGSVAVSELPVLILGESGTGKELVARGVHELSGRTGEFLAINCSAVPEAMLEGEFFGYMRGSFTNAVADKPGLFEVAHEGTVFLDEIGEMSPDLQSKLLRFLETGTLRRVGATRDTQVATRIVAATNRDRAALQGGGGFRSDLYYRLAHAVYELPPLRERGDDVELLLDHFLEHFTRQMQRSVRLAPSVREQLLRYGWPGNVRELRAVVQKIVVAARPDGLVTPRDLPALAVEMAPATYMDERDAGEKRRILKALEQARFVKTDAARMLRISRTTLVGKMKRLGIDG